MLNWKMSKRKIFLFSFIFVGLLFRIYLAMTLPLWHDEAYSIWASKNQLLRILQGATDHVHPPGYYLLLHFWGKISEHLYWFRLLSIIFFLFNTYLLNKLGKRIKDSLFSLILVFLYCFSGYFIIFDWQVRMYSLIVSFILLSIYIFDKGVNRKREEKMPFWIIFTAVNFIGLYIDYSYLWYFIPLTLFSLMFSAIKKNQKFFLISLSLLLSGVLFLLIHPSFITTYKQGIEGITWAKPYLSPNFFIPYFLGTHKNVFLTVTFIIFSLLGIKIAVNSKSFPIIVSVLVLSSVFSLCFSLFYSLFFSPLLHVRSLQIVGIALIVLISFPIHYICLNISKYLFLLFYIVIFINFIVVVQTIIFSPGKVLISFFPWKKVVSSLDTKNTKKIQYQINQQLPTPLLLWGLEYTLKGKESFTLKNIELEEIDLPTEDEKCTLFYNNLLELYNCI
ncbi:MAG: glycosyltransferase family 39 protein [Patescibacteria group bacterium]